MNFNKKSISTIVVGVLVVAVIAYLTHTYIKSKDPMDIQKILREYIKENAGVGAAIGYIDNGNITYYVYGKKDIDSSELIDNKSIFEIGSITKVFTTIALMEIVRQGKICLDDSIKKYLFDVKVPQKNGHEITVWNLATQTSGLPRMPDNFNPQDPANPYIDYSVKQLYEFLNSYTLTKNPGETYEYSNLGFGLLGHILTLAEDQSYDELIKNLICIPLNMKNTGQYVMPCMREHLACGHSLMKKVCDWDWDVFAGAGALRSDIQDMTRFLAANMGLIDTPLYESMKKTQEEQCSFTDKQGLGWIIIEQNDSTIIWHNGGTFGCHSFIGFDPKNKKGVVILSNASDPFPDALGLHILDPVNFKHEKPKKHVEISLNSEIYNQYVGKYTFENNFIISVTKENDSLFAQATRQEKLQIFPESETEFFCKDVNAQVTFVKDKDGMVTQLVLHQDGQDQVAKKIE
jgi:serine-type D-Ala-D-Ala carboxypeptidase/endopeptidase